MGLAVSRSLAAQGWKLAILDLNAKGASIAAELDSLFVEVDVADFLALGKAFARAWEHYGRLDFGATFFPSLPS
jgi:NAD(P)-dependent dehydrogenase (short-subunit alcohol dehydrogenase family)